MSADCFNGFALWDFTAVVYRSDDMISLVLAITSLAPQAIVIALLGALAARPTRTTLMTLMVVFLNECANIVLKKLIAQPRPEHPALGLAQRSDHGMPSRHAQFMACFTVWCAFATTQSSSGIQRRRGGAAPAEKRIVRVAALAWLTMMVCVGRTYNHYHTPLQVVVGVLVGCFVASAMRVVQRAALERAAFLLWPIVTGVSSLMGGEASE